MAGPVIQALGLGPNSFATWLLNIEATPAWVVTKKIYNWKKDPFWFLNDILEIWRLAKDEMYENVITVGFDPIWISRV